MDDKLEKTSTEIESVTEESDAFAPPKSDAPAVVPPLVDEETRDAIRKIIDSIRPIPLGFYGERPISISDAMEKGILLQRDVDKVIGFGTPFGTDNIFIPANNRETIYEKSPISVSNFPTAIGENIDLKITSKGEFSSVPSGSFMIKSGSAGNSRAIGDVFIGPQKPSAPIFMSDEGDLMEMNSEGAERTIYTPPLTVEDTVVRRELAFVWAGGSSDGLATRGNITQGNTTVPLDEDVVALRARVAELEKQITDQLSEKRKLGDLLSVADIKLLSKK